MSMMHDAVIEIIEAHRKGARIQYRYMNSNDDVWRDIVPMRTRPDFNFYAYEYRIKPEPPKPREWWLHIRSTGLIRALLFPCPQSLVSPGDEEIHIREVLPKGENDR